MAKQPEQKIAEPKREPVVEVTASPWGTVSEEEFKTSARDKFYVHGYSDKRAAADESIAKTGKTKAMQHRMQYVPFMTRAGLPINEKVAEYRSRGYQPVLFDECAQYGIDPLQSGFIRGTDGTCQVGSQLLMVAPASVAASEGRKLADINAAQSGAAQARMEQVMEQMNAEAQRRGLRGGATAIYEEQVTTERETR